MVSNNCVSTLLEILEVVKKDEDRMAAAMMFQPFLRFYLECGM